MERQRPRGILIAIVTVFLSFPAVASADQWYDKTEPITRDATVTFSGPIAFGSEIGGVTCTAHAETTLTKGSDVAHIHSYAITTSTCVGSGLLTGCKTKSDISNTPWVATASTPNTLTLTKAGGNITRVTEYEPGCIVGTVDFNFPSMTATADSGSAISTLTISGLGTSNLGEVEAMGTLTSSMPKTFGIGA